MDGEPAVLNVRATAVTAKTAEDSAFRTQLVANVSAAYRLASVILASPTEAEDATQDALERAWRARTTLREADRFEAWLQRIVVNTCRDRVRRRRVRPLFVSFSPGGAYESSLTTFAADPSADAHSRDAIRQAFTRLTVDQRIVVAMRFYLDLEIDEIARRLGTRSGTVKSRLHRGLKVLRQTWESDR